MVLIIGMLFTVVGIGIMAHKFFEGNDETWFRLAGVVVALFIMAMVCFYAEYSVEPTGVETRIEYVDRITHDNAVVNLNQHLRLRVSETVYPWWSSRRFVREQTADASITNEEIFEGK